MRAHEDGVDHDVGVGVQGVGPEAPRHRCGERGGLIAAAPLLPLVPCHVVERRVHRHLPDARQGRHRGRHAGWHRVHEHVIRGPVVGRHYRLSLVLGLGLEVKLSTGWVGCQRRGSC